MDLEVKVEDQLDAESPKSSRIGHNSWRKKYDQPTKAQVDKWASATAYNMVVYSTPHNYRDQNSRKARKRT